MLRSSGLLLLAAAACYGAISNVTVDGVTAQQVIVGFSAVNAAQCTFQVFADSGRTRAIDDTNESLFPGSTACSRPGSIVNGNHVSFVAGIRTAEQGSDGIMHSRSLAALTTYYYAITDQSSGSVWQGQFTTGNLPSGSLYPEPVPYDANGFGNLAYPSLDFSGNGQGCGNFIGTDSPCVDPVTGLNYWLFTSPGADGRLTSPGNGGQTLFTSPTLAAGNCDVPANMVNNPGVNFAQCTGAMDARLTAQSWTVPGSSQPAYAFGVSSASNSFAPLQTVDDVIAVIDGSASDSANNDNVLNACLWSPVANACLGSTFSVALPVGSAQALTVPHALPKPYWQDWGYAPDQGYAAQPSLRIWRAGTGGSVRLSAWFEAATSVPWWNSAGLPMRCDDTARAINFDRYGQPIIPGLNGYLCLVSPIAGPAEAWLWIPYNGDGSVRAEARWLGSPIDSTNPLNVNVQGVWAGALYGAYPATAPTDLASLTYDTSKYSYCNYQDLRTLNSDSVNGGWYPSNMNGTTPNPCFDLTVITQNAFSTMMSAWAAEHPDLPDITQFSNSPNRSVFFGSGVAVMAVATNPEAGSGSPEVLGFFNTDGTLLGVSDTFMNHFCQSGTGTSCSGGQWVSKAGWGESQGRIKVEPGAAWASSAILESTGMAMSPAAGGIWGVSLSTSTPQQQVIGFNLAASGLSTCTVAVYSDAGLTHVVPDSDVSINPNAQSCSRGSLNDDLSSLVSTQGNVTTVEFISGLRGTRKSAVDGQLHSMSLSPATTYFYRIAAGSSTQTGQFTTPNIPVGENFPDMPLFDTTGTNVHNLQYPNMTAGGIVNDPTTGLPARIVSPIRRDMSGVRALNTTAVDLTGGKWSSLANCGTNNASQCASTGAGPGNTLFLPLPVVPNVYYGPHLSGWDPLQSLDDIVFSVYCGSTGSPQTLSISLTRDSGQTAASTAFPVTCPVGSPSLAATLSDTNHGWPSYFFSGWNVIPQWIKAEISPAQSTVNTNGTAVTWVSGDLFVTSVPQNSLISINGAYYSIASFTDTKHLTLTSSAGTQSSVSATMAATGLRIINTTGTNAVSLSVGANYAESESSGFGTFNADQQPCNTNSIPVTYDAQGNPIPATTGYLCSDLELSIWLYVPRNADGSPRLEMRPLSAGFADAAGTVNTNGDPGIGGSGASIGGWDPADPYTYYALIASSGYHIYKITYTPSLNGGVCAQFPGYQYGLNNGYIVDNGSAKNPDCFTWTNLTPSAASPSKELAAQIHAAYASGRNQQNVQVGPAHSPMSDIGWMANLGYFFTTGSTGCVQLSGAGQNWFSAAGCFNLSTGVLQSLTDSFSTYPAIAGGSHTWMSADGALSPWATLTAVKINGSGNTNVPFTAPFQASVAAINLAGYGAAPKWSATTALTPSNVYTCPAFTDPKLAPFSQWSGTQNCIEVKLATPFCNHTPAPNASGGGYSFNGGQSEAQAFPCSTPGFGIPAGASSYSKLWDIFPGMWLWDLSSGDTYGEGFVVATAPTYNAANDIEVWLIRSALDKVEAPLIAISPGNCEDNAASGKMTHSSFSALSVAPPFNCGAAAYYWNVSDPTATNYPDAGYTADVHGVTGVTGASGQFSHILYGNNGYYTAQINLPLQPPPGSLIGSAYANTGAFTPLFSSYSGGGGTLQSYPNLTSATLNAAPSNRRMFDNHAINPSYGYNGETQNVCIGNPLTASLQAGTSQTWLINDPISPGAFDPHLSSSISYAGSHYMKDYSGPATGNVFGDSQTYGYCRVYRNGECRSGSTAGQIYVSLPFVEDPNNCVQTDQSTLAVPTVFNMEPIAGQVVQMDATAYDPAAVLFRKLGFSFRAPGMQYGYQHTWGMPDGRSIMGRIDWADGRFTGLYVAAIPSWPVSNAATPSSGYYNVPIQLPSDPNPNARVLFGYAEYASTSANLYCMSRAEACSTEGNPFAFVNSDNRTLTSCSSGCTINVPVIQGRIAFAQVQRLAANGSVVSSGPIVPIAVPSGSAGVTGAALSGPWDIPVLAVNRAGYGSAAVWDCNGCSGGPTQTSMITQSDMYQCPNSSLVQSLCPGGQCCVQIQVNQEPCDASPYTGSNTFANGTETEPVAFPCTKTDNQTMVNSSWSKLQNSQIGDWMGEDNPTGTTGDWEAFVIAQKTFDSSGNVNGLWLLREFNPEVNAQLWSPLPPHNLTVVRHPCTNIGAGCPSTGQNWSMKMRPSWEQGAGAFWAFPATGGPPMPDNPVGANAQHEDGPTMRVASALAGGNSSDYGAVMGTFAQNIFETLNPVVPENPAFSGSSAPTATGIQSYIGVPQNQQAAGLVPSLFLSWRHFNPASAGPAYQENSFCTYVAAGVTGSIYQLSSDGSGTDCYKSASDARRIPFVGRANPALLKEMSGPNSAAAFAETPDSACYALNANECVAGSTAGSYYVNVPGASYANGCTNLYLLPVADGGVPRPCFYSAAPVGGRLQEANARAFTADASSARLLSYVHSVPGGAAQQSYPSWDPTGNFAFVSSGFLDGKRPDLIALYVPPMASDSAKRSTYRQVQLTLSGTAGDSILVCWGYAENAPAHDPAKGLYPMPRQEGGCSDSAGIEPFMWASEQQRSTPCSAGCTVTLNLIAGRVAYYIVQRTNGASTAASPLQVIAVN